MATIALPQCRDPTTRHSHPSRAAIGERPTLDGKRRWLRITLAIREARGGAAHQNVYTAILERLWMLPIGMLSNPVLQCSKAGWRPGLMGRRQ